MAKARIKWNMKAAGREVGHEETVEIDTVFMQGVIKNRVVTVLETFPTPIEAIEELAALSQGLGLYEKSEAELIGLIKSERPKPRPRRRREAE